MSVQLTLVTSKENGLINAEQAENISPNANGWGILGPSVFP